MCEGQYAAFAVGALFVADPKLVIEVGGGLAHRAFKVGDALMIGR